MPRARIGVFHQTLQPATSVENLCAAYDMSSSPWSSQVVPARLSFLAIYNPTLGPTDESFPEQLVFYYSRAVHEVRVAAKKNGRGDRVDDKVLRDEHNEKLRQIGLAQGMVDFAKSFSDGEPVDSIETDKSRIVVHELEEGWWILASIDLTRLPSASTSTPDTQQKGTKKADAKLSYEYSAREVASPALLTQQILQAHYVFSLHHGPSLTELFVRLSKDKFCSTLERYWNRFCRTWNVLLHGNPAADVFSGLKLASGGELGFGVGEEEWGSGERDVLEDVTRRTEGMVDIVVSRFGEPDETNDSDNAIVSNTDALPWMGNGSEPIASDGVVFGGIGAITRPALRDISLWMRQIYTHGEHAYGIRDNPLRERRKRRRRNPPRPALEADDEAELSGPSNGNVHNAHSKNLRQTVQQNEAAKQLAGATDMIDPTILPKDDRPQIHGRTASRDHALQAAEHTPPIPSHPGIPRPIVSAAEQALDKATKKAEQVAIEDKESVVEAADSGTTMGIPDQYMKYLTFGLSELAKPSKPSRPAAPKRTSTASSVTLKPLRSNSNSRPAKQSAIEAPDESASLLAQVDPIPDGETIRARLAMQRRQENKGHFVIGLKGDLDDIPANEKEDVTDGSANDNSDGSRTVIRTIQVEVVSGDEGDAEDDVTSGLLQRRKSNLTTTKTTQHAKNFRRLRVLIYVRRPFMYCLLFENQTTLLSWSKFYKDLHQNLQAIHKPLLSSTNTTNVAQRIEDSHEGAGEDAASIRSAGINVLPTRGSVDSSPIFDLIFDPRLLTLHTSIPNIPDPGTPAAEGLASGTGQAALSSWTRVEALNVHAQILSTLTSVNTRQNDVERTSKTNRGWWVVWMRVSPSAPSFTMSAPEQEAQPAAEAGSTATVHADHRGGLLVPDDEDNTAAAPTTPRPLTTIYTARGKDMHRTAFLVRKSSEVTTKSTGKTSTSSRMASGVWGSLTLRPGPTEEEKAGGAGDGWGPAALAGGIGFDARRYVEGLLSLNR